MRSASPRCRCAGGPRHPDELAELVERGVDVGSIDDVGQGVKCASFRDPDGNLLLLQEMPWRTGDAF